MEQPITLESIRQEKAELQKRINDVKQRMSDSTAALMTEPTPLTQRERVMNSISKGMAIVDGAILGYRLLKHAKSFFNWRKAKKQRK